MNMTFEEKFDQAMFALDQSREAAAVPMERFRAEVEFAKQFSELFADKQAEWQGLIGDALDMVTSTLCEGGSVADVIAKAEDHLAPIGKKAKEYTIHCCGHAHIDMNWLWPWQETVNVSHDTFATVDTLMEEFPEFRFSQSQASTYIAMEEYCPEIFEKIKNRVKSGQWDVTASMWVEGEKNFVSGESLCRHMLYTRQYFKQRFGFEPEDVKIDWSPDTFGHAHTLPSIVSRGAVTRYYFCRTGPGPWLFKWRSPDGSEILAYNDKGGYNGVIDPNAMRWLMCGFVKETGLKDFMFMYGVGDHGGGPTRRDLRKFREIQTWPIYPTVKLSKTSEFYSAVEAANPKLPVIDSDLNFTFEGCYTAQSNIKRANRVSEIILPEAETMALIAGAVAGMDYPKGEFFRGWRHTLFNHFHDILPGSGIHATYEYSQGLFQEIQATAGAVRTRALRALASKVDTESIAAAKLSILGPGFGDGLGAGAGDPGIPGGVTARNAGAAAAEPVLIYNQKAWPRTETVFAKVWNKPLNDDKVVVRDPEGKEVKGQVVARGNYWGHNFATVAFEAQNVPATGYKVYAIDSGVAPLQGEGVKITRELPEGTESMIVELNEGVMENEFLRVEIDAASGAIAHLIDKATGFDFVPEGDLLGVIEAYQEVPHGMTAWVIGQIMDAEQLISGGQLHVVSRGPNRAAYRTDRKWRDSRISVEIGLNAGSRMIDFTVRLHWVERGTGETGVPMLKAAFPVNVDGGVPTYEIPFGSQKRKQSQQEIPALKWADLSDEKRGLTLVNSSKYGHSCDEDTLRLTLIRSSYDPDPLPEIADHEIRFAVIPHMGALDVAAAIREGEQFNSPLAVVSAPVQKGELPAEKSFVECLSPNVIVTTVKKAEESDAVVIRTFECEGKETQAKIKVNGLVKQGASVVETDVLERPLGKSTAKMDGDTVTVTVPAFGQATVKIG